MTRTRIYHYIFQCRNTNARTSNAAPNSRRLTKEEIEELVLAGEWDNFETFAEWKKKKTLIPRIEINFDNLMPGVNTRQMRFVVRETFK